MDYGDINVIYGDNPATMTTALLQKLALEKKFPPTASVVIKPDLSSLRACNEGVTTHPHIIVSLILSLKKMGFKDISIACACEANQCIEDIVYFCGYEIVSEKTHTPLLYLEKQGFVTKTAGGLRLDISKVMMQADLIINVPVLKAHPVHHLAGATTNMLSCLSMHSRVEIQPPWQEQYVAYVNKLLPTQVVITDSICGDIENGLGSAPFPTNIMYSCSNPVMADSYGCSIFGFTPRELPHLALSELLGVGTTSYNPLYISELNDYIEEMGTSDKFYIKKLEKFAQLDNPCQGCYNSLIHAFARLQNQDLLHIMAEKIYAGKNYEHTGGNHVGIGRCCSGFACCVGGCAPTATEVYDKIYEMLSYS